MPSTFYGWRDGAFVQIGSSDFSESVAPFVHDDTLPQAITNLVTGFTTESTSAYLRNCKENNLQVVGNDLLSKKKRNLPDRINEDLVLDRIERAEAKLNDPDKRRELENRNLRALEQREKLLGNRG